MIVDGSAVNVKPGTYHLIAGLDPTAMSASMIADREFTPSAYFWFTIAANSFSAWATCDVSPTSRSSGRGGRRA